MTHSSHSGKRRVVHKQGQHNSVPLAPAVLFVFMGALLAVTISKCNPGHVRIIVLLALLLLLCSRLLIGTVHLTCHRRVSMQTPRGLN